MEWGPEVTRMNSQAKYINGLQLDVKTRMQAPATRAHLFCSSHPRPSGACADDTWQDGHALSFFW